MQVLGMWLLIFLSGSIDCPPAPCEAAPEKTSDTSDFILVKKEGNIVLYERWYAVTADQQAREVKATFTVNAAPEEAEALIKDESRGRQWNKNTTSYKILSENETWWICYIQYDLPWPVSNQDCVLEYTHHYADSAVHLTFKGIDHPAFPVRKRIQRIPEISGKWILTRTDNGIAIEYYITTTPSSTLPAWLTDPIIRNNLIETLREFRSILEEKD